MNAFEWDDQFNRLKNHFHPGSDVDVDALGFEFFEALKHWHIDAVQRGITDVIRNAKESYFPPIGVIREIIQARLSGMERTKNDCATCEGSGWIESWPEMSSGIVYERHARCPDCGIPAPEVKRTHKSRPLTRAEHDDWREGRAYRDTMPDWAKPKKERDPNETNEIREFMSNLRDKLFGHQDRYEP